MTRRRRRARAENDPLAQLVGTSANTNAIATQRVLAPAKYEAMARMVEAELEMEMLREQGRNLRDAAREEAANPLYEAEDNRRFHPDIYRSPVKAVGDMPFYKSWEEQPSYRIGEPIKKPVLCVRRTVRKQVLFALRKTRKGSGAKRRKWNRWSKVSC